jgi:hypothetical protein
VEIEELTDAAERGDSVSAKKGIRRASTLCGKTTLSPETEEVEVSIPFHSSSLGEVSTAKKVRRDSTKLEAVTSCLGMELCCLKGDAGSACATAKGFALLSPPLR